jgi:hypothetical protein
MEVREAPVAIEHRVGPAGWLGRWAADYLRLVALTWDALLLRLILIPTLLRVFGHSAWALPRWLDRILPDVRSGHS